MNIEKWGVLVDALKWAIDREYPYNPSNYDHCCWGIYWDYKYRTFITPDKIKLLDGNPDKAINNEFGLAYHQDWDLRSRLFHDYDKKYSLKEQYEYAKRILEDQMSTTQNEVFTSIRKDEVMTPAAVFTPITPPNTMVELNQIAEGKWYVYENTSPGSNEYLTRSNGQYIRYMKGKFEVVAPYGKYVHVKELKDGILGFTVKV